MFTTPTWPAVVDAFTRRDYEWVKKATQRLWLLVGGYGLAAIIALPTLGTIILPLHFHERIPLRLARASRLWNLLHRFSLGAY